MPTDCQRSTPGGKGNIGMFVERYPKICAAGLPSSQPDDHVVDSLEHYLLKDEVDALINDAIIPSPKPRPLPPLRNPIHLDMRYAGPYCEIANIINPPIKTKFKTLVDDFKETSYKSYWKQPLGQVQDPVPMFPEGFKIQDTTFGKKTPFHGRLYDIVMPKEPLPDNTDSSKRAGYQTDRHYCSPPYRSDVTYGRRTFIDKRGTYGKCCLTDDRVILGTAGRTVLNTVQSNFQYINQSKLGTALTPNNNISNVPEGYSFGLLKPPDNLPDCLTFCEINPGRDCFKKCLGHLNCLRKCLSKKFLPTFFRGFYLNLKYLDKEQTGWLPKENVYEYCANKLIRFDPALIEPLLSMWQAFDGSKIKYKTFVHIINYREPSPDLPKIEDISSDCLDFRTTYSEMVKPNQEVDKRRMAGVPSGRYFDMDYPVTPEGCCRADRLSLPHETDMKLCIAPSVLTLFNVNHRDMYAKRDPQTIRRVFEATGEQFSEEKFRAVWKEAEKYNSQGWVCFETFRRALGNFKSIDLENDQKES